MPSPKLTQIVEMYDQNTIEGRDDPKRRMEACQQMWKLRDPEAIMFLKIIYEEDTDPLVQAEAAEVLTNFRRIQREREASRSGKSKSTGLGWRLLRSILLLTFVGLLILNGLFFWANTQDDEANTVVDNDEGISSSSGRQEIVSALDQSLANLVDDAVKLQVEWQKVESGNNGDCLITLNRPQPIELTESQMQQFPDISSLISDEFGDYRFSFGAFNDVLGFWDAYCAGTLAESNLLGNVERLREPIGLATNIRANIIPSFREATAIPTVGPSPTPTLPPTETPVPTATFTPEPLANVRYEEHLSALENLMSNNRNTFDLIKLKWDPATRGRPVCSGGQSIDAPYLLPPDQQGDVDLDEAVRLVEEALSFAAQADVLYEQNCVAETLNSDPNVDPTAEGLRLINTSIGNFALAQEKINALRIKVAS